MKTRKNNNEKLLDDSLMYESDFFLESNFELITNEKSKIWADSFHITNFQKKYMWSLEKRHIELNVIKKVEDIGRIIEYKIYGFIYVASKKQTPFTLESKNSFFLFRKKKLIDYFKVEGDFSIFFSNNTVESLLSNLKDTELKIFNENLRINFLFNLGNENYSEIQDIIHLILVLEKIINSKEIIGGT